MHSIISAQAGMTEQAGMTVQAGMTGAPGSLVVLRHPDENKIQFKEIKLGRHFRTTVEVVSGITKTDKVILNPPDGAYNVQTVEVIKTQRPVI